MEWSEKALMATSSDKVSSWQCRACSGQRVTDRLLGVVGQRLEIHRLVCEQCGAIGHYDRKPGQQQPMVRTGEDFLWNSETENA